MVTITDLMKKATNPNKGITKDDLQKAIDDMATAPEDKKIFTYLQHADSFKACDKNKDEFLSEKEIITILANRTGAPDPIKKVNEELDVDDFRSLVHENKTVSNQKIEEYADDIFNKNKTNISNTVKDSIHFGNQDQRTGTHTIRMFVGKDNNLHMIAAPYDKTKPLVEYIIPITKNPPLKISGLEAFGLRQGTLIKIPGSDLAVLGQKTPGHTKTIDLTDSKNDDEKSKFVDFISKNFSIDKDGNLTIPEGFAETIKVRRHSDAAGYSLDELRNTKLEDYKPVNGLEHLIDG